jgi:hypothetical protein
VGVWNETEYWKGQETMHILKAKWFNKFAEKAGITDIDLTAAADEINRGEYEADLGGGVFKKRIARSGSGKSGGYRVILFFRKEDRLFFEYAYPKSQRDNIDEKELVKFKRLAKAYLEFTDEQIKARLKDGRLKEIGT